MATSNTFALLYGSDDQAYNASVTNKEPVFAASHSDHVDGCFDLVLQDLATAVQNASAGKKKIEAEGRLQEYQAWKDKDDELRNASLTHLKQVKSAAKAIGAGDGTPLASTPDLRYRLEALDERRHRMGDYLQGAFGEFSGLHASDKPNFFRWVEDTVAKDPNAAERWNPDLFKNASPAQKAKYCEWFKEGVKYIKGEQQRQHYAVKVEEGELSRRGPSKTAKIEKLDSAALVDHFKNGTKQEPVNTCIWVMSPTGNFYSHVGKVGRFHHSSLQGGENVAAAGEWKVTNGKLAEIDGTTGHYKVDSAGFVQAIQKLESQKALLPDTKVILYAKDGTKVPVSAIDFAKNSPTFLQDKTTYNPARHG